MTDKQLLISPRGLGRLRARLNPKMFEQLGFEADSPAARISHAGIAAELDSPNAPKTESDQSNPAPNGDPSHCRVSDAICNDFQQCTLLSSPGVDDRRGRGVWTTCVDDMCGRVSRALS